MKTEDATHSAYNWLFNYNENIYNESHKICKKACDRDTQKPDDFWVKKVAEELKQFTYCLYPDGILPDGENLNNVFWEEIIYIDLS